MYMSMNLSISSVYINIKCLVDSRWFQTQIQDYKVFTLSPLYYVCISFVSHRIRILGYLAITQSLYPVTYTQQSQIPLL